MLLPVVHVVLDTDMSEPMPTELVEVIEEVEAQRFWARLFGGTATRRRTEERELGGWRRFPLSPDAANLNELEGALDEASYLQGAPE